MACILYFGSSYFLIVSYSSMAFESPIYYGVVDYTASATEILTYRHFKFSAHDKSLQEAGPVHQVYYIQQLYLYLCVKNIFPVALYLLGTRHICVLSNFNSIVNNIYDLQIQLIFNIFVINVDLKNLFHLPIQLFSMHSYLYKYTFFFLIQK